MTGVRPNLLVTLAHLSDLTPKPTKNQLWLTPESGLSLEGSDISATVTGVSACY